MKKVSKTIYFVRHGQSEANVLPIFQSSESPLNEVGSKQAELIAERISKISFETLISSPWPRARQTTEIISKVTGKIPEYNDMLVERIKPKKIEGKSYEDPEAKDIWSRWEKSLYKKDLRIEDGENFDDLTKRVDNILHFLEKRTESEIVVVTHGYFIARIIARIILQDSLTPENIFNFHKTTFIDNTGLTVIERIKTWENEDIWRLRTYNDRTHLG